MNRIICTIPYCQNDIGAARRLLNWIKELGGVSDHFCLLAADSNVPKEQRLELYGIAQQGFGAADSIPITIPTTGYPPNQMFMLTAQQIMFSFKWPFLWLEPDAVPLQPEWMDALTSAYDNSPKRFMGCLVKGTQPGLPAVHLPGVSVYPNDAFLLYDKFNSIKSANVAWDMEAADAVVPRSYNTPLIQHFWGKRDLSPTFVHENKTGQPENALPLSFIKPDAVLFHRNKDGSLIALLREKLNDNPPVNLVEPAAAPKPRGRPRKVSPAPMIDAT